MRKRILVADDKDDEVKNLTTSLEQAGYEVIRETTCADARKRISEGRLEVAILDENMEERDRGASVINETASTMPEAILVLRSRTFDGEGKRINLLSYGDLFETLCEGREVGLYGKTPEEDQRLLTYLAEQLS